MQKQEKFLLEGHNSTSLHQKHKSAIWNQTPPHLHIKPSLYVCRRVQGSQIFKQNWIISIRLRVIVIFPIWVYGALGGWAGGWGVSGVINYSLYEFRNVQRYRIFKQNWIILISSRVIEFWCFRLPAALGAGGWVVVGGAPHTCAHACTCTHVQACTCMHGKHGNFMQMAAPIGFGEILGIAFDVIHACMCVHVHACVCVCTWVGCTLSPPPTPIHPPPTPQGGTLGIIQNSIVLELIKIFQFCLKIWNLWRLPHPWVGV